MWELPSHLNVLLPSFPCLCCLATPSSFCPLPLILCLSFWKQRTVPSVMVHQRGVFVCAGCGGGHCDADWGRRMGRGTEAGEYSSHMWCLKMCNRQRVRLVRDGYDSVSHEGCIRERPNSLWLAQVRTQFTLHDTFVEDWQKWNWMNQKHADTNKMKMKFLAVGEALTAMFWPTLGLKTTTW